MSGFRSTASRAPGFLPRRPGSWPWPVFKLYSRRPDGDGESGDALRLLSIYLRACWGLSPVSESSGIHMVPAGDTWAIEFRFFCAAKKSSDNTMVFGYLSDLENCYNRREPYLGY